MNKIGKIHITIFIILLFGTCKMEDPPLEDPSSYELEIPAGFPLPAIPEDNQLSEARVSLGRKLFYDPILSRDTSISCASCHKQTLAFADNVPISPGVDGRMGMRNAPTLANVAYLELINKDGGVPKLDLQPIVPIEDENEMDLHPLRAADRLNEMPEYPELFQEAYQDKATPFTVSRALGAFMRTILSGNAPFDRYHFQGDSSALNSSEKRGMALFFSERTQCSTCHQGFNFTTNQFKNNGLYKEFADPGRYRVTLNEADRGFFRIPTLRNIALTAPYMHDGSLATLEEVVEHYNQGGQQAEGQSSLIHPLNLNEQEKEDLIKFLHTLTDEELLNNPKLSN